MDPPLMKAEQNRAIRVADLTEVVVGRSRFRQAKQRLVPRQAAGHIGDSDDGPRTSHETAWGVAPAGTGFDDPIHAPASPTALSQAVAAQQSGAAVRLITICGLSQSD